MSSRDVRAMSSAELRALANRMGRKTSHTMYGDDELKDTPVRRRAAPSPPPPPPPRPPPAQKLPPPEPSPTGVEETSALFTTPPTSPAVPTPVQTTQQQYAIHHIVTIEQTASAATTPPPPPFRPSSPSSCVSSQLSEQHDVWGRSATSSPLPAAHRDERRRRYTHHYDRERGHHSYRHEDGEGGGEEAEPAFRVRRVISVSLAGTTYPPTPPTRPAPPPPPRPPSPQPSLSTIESSEYDIWGLEPPLTPPSPTAADRAMFGALASGDSGVPQLRRALLRGAHVNMADEFGWTPVAIASACGHDRLVRELVQHGARPGAGGEAVSSAAKRYLRVAPPRPGVQPLTRDVSGGGWAGGNVGALQGVYG